MYKLTAPRRSSPTSWSWLEDCAFICNYKARWGHSMGEEIFHRKLCVRPEGIRLEASPLPLRVQSAVNLERYDVIRVGMNGGKILSSSASV